MKARALEQVVALRQWMIEREDELLTSALTLGEGTRQAHRGWR